MHTATHSINTSISAPRFAIGENVARTMSSREMSELTGKRHDSVKRTIETLAFKTDKEGKPAPVIGTPQIVEYLDTLGRPANEYHVNKRDSFVVVAQLCPEFTAKLVDRWQELEAQAAKPVELSTMDILQIAMASEKARLLAVEQLAIAAPKVAFVDQYVEAAGTFSFRQVAKTIGANERQFRQMLLDTSTMYYLGGVLTPSAQHIASGRFEVKTGTSEHNGHAFTQARFTAKGVEWIAGKWKQYSEVAA